MTHFMLNIHICVNVLSRKELFKGANKWKSEWPGLGCRVGAPAPTTDCTATIHRHVQHCEEDSYATPLTSYVMSHGHLCKTANINFSIDDTSIQN
jgi:hypothetical protein